MMIYMIGFVFKLGCWDDALRLSVWRAGGVRRCVFSDPTPYSTMV